MYEYSLRHPVWIAEISVTASVCGVARTKWTESLVNMKNEVKKLKNFLGIQAKKNEYIHTSTFEEMKKN